MGIYKNRLDALEQSFFKDAWQEVDEETYEELLSKKPDRVRFEKKRKWKAESKQFIEYDVYYASVDPNELSDEDKSRYIKLTTIKKMMDEHKARDTMIQKLIDTQEQGNRYLRTIKRIQVFWLVLFCIVGGGALAYLVLYLGVVFGAW